MIETRAGTFDFEFESYIGAGDGSLTVHVNGGIPPYSYLWSNGGTDSTISDLPFGIYSVEVWDATGCPADASIYLPVQVGIENVFAKQINIYPNPITDFATVDFPFWGSYMLRTTDLSGKTVQSQTVTGKKSILQRDHLPPGIYLLSITNNSGMTAIKKLVIQ